jgi:hypothetical protein
MKGIRAAWAGMGKSPRRLALAAVVTVVGLSVGVGFAIVMSGIRQPSAMGASPSAVAPDASPSEAASPSPSQPGPTATPFTAAPPSPTNEAQPAPTMAAIPLDTVVATTVEALSVRRSPGAAGERIGLLELGTTAFVMAGPTLEGGVPWYRISGMGLPYASGCPTTPPDQPISCPAFQGWVAGANEVGDPWLQLAEVPACPEPTVTSISEWGYTWRLVCWADSDITFDAWWPEIPDDAGLGGICPESEQPWGFLYCQHINYNGLAASPEEGFVARISPSIDPASGIVMPARGQWIRVTGRFDHPTAAECAEVNGPDLFAYSETFGCRLQFVPSAIEALGL